MKTTSCFNCALIFSPKYLSEVSVEGSCTSIFNKKMLNYEKYIIELIKSGSCITLISKPISIQADSFFCVNSFLEYSKFVYWTFNNKFLYTLIDQINECDVTDISCFINLLNENKVPFGDQLKGESGEIEFCIQKNADLKKEPGFTGMFELDVSNRLKIIMALMERKTVLETKMQKHYSLAS